MYGCRRKNIYTLCWIRLYSRDFRDYLGSKWFSKTRVTYAGGLYFPTGILYRAIKDSFSGTYNEQGKHVNTIHILFINANHYPRVKTLEYFLDFKKLKYNELFALFKHK